MAYEEGKEDINIVLVLLVSATKIIFLLKFN